MQKRRIESLPARGTWGDSVRKRPFLYLFLITFIVLIFVIASNSFAQTYAVNLNGNDISEVHCNGRRLFLERISKNNFRLTCLSGSDQPPTPTNTPQPPPPTPTQTALPAPTNTATPIPAATVLSPSPTPISTDCWPTDTPAGSLPGQPPPVLCNIVNAGPDTSVPGNNRWFDAFDHGLSFANFANTGYQLFEAAGGIYKSIHWRHANHWMVDIVPHANDNTPYSGLGGAIMRPNSSFHFENGKLVVETDVAAGMLAYANKAWPEIVVSMGSAPEGPTQGGSTYAYDLFPSSWTLGCRLQTERRPICALKDDSGNYESGTSSYRVWEMSWFQLVGTEVFGGTEFGEQGNYWRLCQTTDPDSQCRDRFRLELTQTSLTMYVNGIKYFEQTGLPPLPDSFVNGDLYVYFASMQAGHDADTIRFHWDRVAINPDEPPSAAPGFSLP